MQEKLTERTSVVLGMMLLPAGMGLNTTMLHAQRDNRSGGERTAIIAGSAAAGAALGGLLGGTRGAVAGAIAGGSGGAVYDRATTDDRNRRGERSAGDTAIVIGGSSGAGAAAGGILGERRAILSAPESARPEATSSIRQPRMTGTETTKVDTGMDTAIATDTVTAIAGLVTRIAIATRETSTID